jgi:anti-anti-sigma regulatory factor
MIVNMADVDSVSSAGIAGLYLIGELLEGRATYDQDPEGWVVYDQMHEALEQGRAFTRLFLAAPNERVASTLRVTQFDRLARTLPSVEDAISLLA